ncbi:MAG: hypothetical protein IJH41_01020 [Eubacterium sp.]|nr:hypothetical protein [Eubacterium sp.]
MSETIREYDAKVDNKKRLTLRETPYEYYHVKHNDDGSILLQPRELVAPDSVYLSGIPGMKEKLIEGRDTPLSDTVSEDEVEW